MGRGEARVRGIERVAWRLLLPYVKQIGGFVLWLRKLKQGLCINLQGGEGIRGRFRREGL